MVGIYKITSPSGKIYIGQSVNIEGRISKYRTARCFTQRILLRSIQKYGWDNHKLEIVLECKTEELNHYERYYQDLYDCIGKNGLNCMLTTTDTKSGKASESTIAILTGRKLPESTRQKMRDKKLSTETKTKISKSNIGRIVSEKTRSKISESNKGKKRTQEYIDKMKLRVVSEETKLKLSIASKGKKASEETKLKLSIAKKGKKPTEQCLLKAKERTSKKVINTVTGEIYNSATELASILGIKRTTLTARLSGKSTNYTNYRYL